MNSLARKFLIGTKAVRQLGWLNTWLYASYRLQLAAGVLRWRTPMEKKIKSKGSDFSLHLPVFQLPDKEKIKKILGEAEQRLIAEANDIVSGQVRLFGGNVQALNLVPTGKLSHWTDHTGHQHGGVDIKFVWEPGRFGWATVLARAYHLTRDEKYSQAFWDFIEQFLLANPTNIGPHWASAQEVGLRLIAMIFAAGIFNNSMESSDVRMRELAVAIAAHAERIPPTLGYARAQNNNHLLTEAAALYSAAVVLPDHPRAAVWRKLGWRWLHAGLDQQIAADGEYSQHSANYHRLMLQAALWVHLLSNDQGDIFPETSKLKLAAATEWLFCLQDSDSGKVPNLGSNDGAYILPLTVCDFGDYRPVLQAAGRAFTGEDLLPAGYWDEMACWLAPVLSEKIVVKTHKPLRLESDHSWAYLRAASYLTRPSHADQLHLDLWWKGTNIALDGGTYQYNANPPWRNGLDLSSLHNTLTVNGREQMTKAGQFLWLDWAQAEVIGVKHDIAGRVNWAAAQHDGYREIGVNHQREVSLEGNQWLVRDEVLPMDGRRQSGRYYQVRLHWLLLNGDWALKDTTLLLEYPMGSIEISVNNPDCKLTTSLVRAGKSLIGDQESASTRGWYSPTYGLKHPALSFSVTAEVTLPTTFSTVFQVPE